MRLLWLPAALALAAGCGVALAGQAAAQPRDDPLGYVIDVDAIDRPEVIARGRELYEVGCVSCHGVRGEGVTGPSIEDSGAASAHFFLTSGRMPGNDLGQSQRKDPAYDPAEIEALVAYVASLGEGPPIPELDLADADLAGGGELFRENCAACHQAAGAGGALSYGRNAPTLTSSTPVQVAEVIRTGPGQMPVFGAEQLDDGEVAAIARYVQFLREGEDPGGFTLGRVGPIPEGFVALVGALGATSLAAFWVGKRRLEDDEDVAEGVEDETEGVEGVQ